MVTTADPQAWRLETPGHAGWQRSPRPGDPHKYFMITVDSHVSEPADLWVKRIDKKYRHRLPRVEVDDGGVKWQVAEGYRPTKIRDLKLEGEDLERGLRGTGGFASDQELAWDIQQRLEDHARDGIDAETIYPNKGLAMWATPDPVFAMAQCRVYNEWVWEIFANHNDRMAPMAAIATGDLDGSIAEIQRVEGEPDRAKLADQRRGGAAPAVDHLLVVAGDAVAVEERAVGGAVVGTAVQHSG